MSELIDSILATAPKHEPEFETRLFDENGALVALLPMELKGRSLYVSETYRGPNRLVAVLIFRDGAPWRVVAQNLGVVAGFSLNATIPIPEAP